MNDFNLFNYQEETKVYQLRFEDQHAEDEWHKALERKFSNKCTIEQFKDKEIERMWCDLVMKERGYFEEKKSQVKRLKTIEEIATWFNHNANRYKCYWYEIKGE